MPTVKNFVFRHYHTLYNDKAKYVGIYICQNCDYYTEWKGGPDEFITCKKCGGMMPIRDILKTEYEKWKKRQRL